MPYQELTALDIRKEMVNEYLSNNYTITELSDRYGLARKTIYKWLERYHSQGEEGFTFIQTSSVVLSLPGPHKIARGKPPSF